MLSNKNMWEGKKSGWYILWDKYDELQTSFWIKTALFSVITKQMLFYLLSRNIKETVFIDEMALTLD